VLYDQIEKMRTRDVVKTHWSVANFNGQEIRFNLDEMSDWECLRLFVASVLEHITSSLIVYSILLSYWTTYANQ
jgi:hypothetical protein